MAQNHPDLADSGPGSRRGLYLIGAVVAALLLVGGVVVWWLNRDDAPEAASLETATESLADDADADAPADADDDSAESDAGTGDGDAGADNDAENDADTDDGDAAPVGIDGSWTVDTSVGEFSFEDSTGTFVGFRVKEELQAVGEIEAVGRTPGVSGTITIEGDQVTATQIEADMAAITTNDSRRDNRVRGALEVDDFPTATFVLTEPIDLGPGVAGGAPVSVTATGDLTVHGVTQSVTFDVDAQLVDQTIVIVGSTELTFSDFGVTVPSAPIVLSAEDSGVVELQLFLERS